MITRGHIVLLVFTTLILALSCKQENEQKPTMVTQKNITAKDILGNPEYLAISYGGYREGSREIQPTVDQLKEDMLIMHAMGIRLLRTYNVQLPHASNVLKAIRDIQKENPDFEMYVMLGAWIDCKNAWTEFPPDHDEESEQNEAEIARAAALAKEYPEIVKIIAVGNEAMVKWAASYYVQPWVILKWVNHLQELKSKGELPEGLWITSSDNFASWGGGASEYHVDDLNELIKAVDFISMHTYPMHDTHYNPDFWGILEEEANLSDIDKIGRAMDRALEYAQSQYDSVKSYMKSLKVDKPIHIGETGWASVSAGYYGQDGSKACDEYKESEFYSRIRNWTNGNKISCFYFEAFDEPWKDPHNSRGSENHFGLFTVDGQAKYVIWDLVDQGVFEGLGRNGKPITKTFEGNEEAMMETVKIPAMKEKLEVTF